MPTMSVRVFEDSERGALVSWYPRDGTCLGGDPVSQVGEGVTDDAEFEQFVGLGQLVTEVLRHALGRECFEQCPDSYPHWPAKC